MIACESYLTQTFLHRLAVVQISFRYGGHSDYCVHRRADIVRHGRKEVCFGVIRLVRFLCRRLQSFIKIYKERKVDKEQNNKSAGDHGYKQPVDGPLVQIRGGQRAEKDPSVGSDDPRMRYYHLFAA